ncbi:hypothetical protein NPIL_545131 [Nephila pilipes]|uniref:CCDC81 HU domain-containing protein n=1 Tax=Nephila pilipes TaxID=299642 RepID=A0A8X6UNR4_NEPPI|nr:hypothetical protein NPIL_545131 [Nephila pilipes]
MKSIEEVFKEAAELPYSLMGKEITMEDAVTIWKAVGKFIRYYLQQDKHVILPNIGKFYVQEVKIPVAHNPARCLCRKRLVFQISSQLALNFRIKFSPDQIEDPNPQIRVNRSTVSCLCHKPRFKVDLCLREIVAYVFDRLAAKIPVQLPFTGIGVLIIKGETYRMLFDDRFTTKIEEADCIKEIL